MAKKAAKQKLLFKPTPISRLSRMKVPFPMVGDPKWNHHASGNQAWESRQRAVYDFEMDKKRLDERGWNNATYYEALSKNRHIRWLEQRFDWDYALAQGDNWLYEYEQAWRDNAAFDYHRENFLEDA